MMLAALTVAFALTLNAQTTQKVLFIGNSYVYTNDLPNAIKTIALGCGDTLEYSQSTPGGCTFHQHLSNTTTMNYVNAGGWDKVILQEQSQLPSFPIGQVQNECFPYAQQLCQQIRHVTPSTGIVFFMTWGRKNGDASNCANYPPLCTYQGMDSLLYWRYMQMAEDNSAIVSPVGRVWHVIRDNHPEIELYSSDESHPSVAGTYAAAVTFYTILFRKSPALITNNLTVDAATAQIIRETVQTVVFDSLDFWYQYAPNTSIAHAAYGQKATIFPNPCGEQINILTSNGKNAEIYDVFGKLVDKVSLSENNTSVSLSNCKSGVYFVRIMDDGRLVETVKIVKR